MTSPAGTVLVVDDDESVRRGVSRLLRALGYDVSTFASGREFLEHPAVTGPACLLLDVRMPDQSGFELFDALKASGRKLPVIFITGHGDIPMAVRAIKSGAIDFLTKPFDEQALRAAIEHAIAQARKDCGC